MEQILDRRVARGVWFQFLITPYLVTPSTLVDNPGEYHLINRSYFGHIFRFPLSEQAHASTGQVQGVDRRTLMRC